jgi:hypothetical protein
VYWKLFWRAATEEDMMVARQVLPPLLTTNQEFYWEYTYPLVLLPLMSKEEDDWQEYCQK